MFIFLGGTGGTGGTEKDRWIGGAVDGFGGAQRRWRKKMSGFGDAKRRQRKKMGGWRAAPPE